MVDFELEPVVSEPGSVSGTVTSAQDGGPTGGATVLVEDEDRVLVLVPVTNSEGDYQVAGAPAGTYEVITDADGYVSLTEQGIEARR